MKIIICTHNLYGGGAERVASLWAKGFYDQGHEVTMFLAENKIAYDIPDVPIVVIGNEKFLIRQYISWYRVFRKQFKALKPDVFISVNHPWAPIAKLAAIGTNIKVISTEHNAYVKPEYIKMSFMDRLHKFYLNKYVDAVTVLTKADKQYIGNRLSNVYVLPNPLTFEPVNSIPIKEKVILAVGRIDFWHVKGFDLLAKAWNDIASDYPDWRLRIIGTGSDSNRQFIRSLAPNVADRQFEILDFDNLIIEHYKNSSIFVLSSRYEGFGMVLLEAMSQGCACIACDYKGRQKEIVNDGVDGIVVNPNDVDSLKEAFVSVIEDENFMTLLQEKAIIGSSKFELYKIMKIWNDILQRN